MKKEVHVTSSSPTSGLASPNDVSQPKLSRQQFLIQSNRGRDFSQLHIVNNLLVTIHMQITWNLHNNNTLKNHLHLHPRGSITKSRGFPSPQRPPGYYGHDRLREILPGPPRANTPTTTSSSRSNHSVRSLAPTILPGRRPEKSRPLPLHLQHQLQAKMARQGDPRDLPRRVQRQA